MMFRDLPRYAATKPNAFWQTDVPAAWQEVPGLAVVSENQNKNGVLTETQVLSLSFGKVVVKPVELQRGLVPESYENYQILDPGDIVIRPTDLQNDQRSIRVGLVRERGIITSAYIGLRATGDWESEYTYLYLSVVDSSKRIYGMGSGLRQQLGWADIKRMPCLVPSREEQAAIVKYLAHANARIDRAITAKRRLIAFLEEQKLATVDGAVLAGWPCIPIKRALQSMTAGIWGASPEESNDPARWCVRVADFDYPAAGVMDSPKTHRAIADREFSPRSLIRGDLLLEGSGGGDKTPVGRVVIFDHDEDAVCSNFLQRLRPADNVDPKFLALMLRRLHASGEVRKYIKQTTGIQNLDLGAYLSREIPMPPLMDQQRAASAVEAELHEIDTVVSRVQQEIALLREFRTRLVADVVMGQVDVRAVAAMLPDAPEPVDDLAADSNDDVADALVEVDG